MHRQFNEAGIPVFSLHRILSDGSCECGTDCNSAGKHPATSSWQNTPIWDDAQLDAFDDMGWMDTGYGVLVNGLLVVDIDPRNGGDESYNKLAQDCPDITTAGFIVATGGGGRHLYFRAPDGVSLRQSHPGYPGIDFKSTGYTVGPGSLHASGKRYTLVVGDGPDDIGIAPPGLVELLKMPDYHRVHSQGQALDVSDHDITSMIKSINPDCDHDTWVQVGMAIHEITSGTGFDLWDSWSRRGKKYPGAEKMDRRWHSFGRSETRVGYGTLHKYASQAGWIEPVTFEYHSEEQTSPVTNEPSAPKPRHQVWLDTLLEDRKERVARFAAQPWLIDGVLPAGGVASLVGGSGVGKSFVAIDMACCVAAQRNWHDNKVDDPGDVIYVSAEGAGGIDKRVLAWAQSHGQDDVPGVRMLLDAPIIDDQKDAALVSETLAELARRTGNKPRLVVLDTLNRVMMGEENSATAMAALMRGVEQIRQRLGCAVLIIHHTGHGEQGRARGSSAFFAALDSEITIKQTGTMVVELENTKSKDSEAFDPIRLKLDKVTIEGVHDRHGRPVTSLVPRTMGILEEGVALGEMTEDEVALLDIVEQIGAAKPYDDDLRDAFYEEMGELSQRQKRERYRKAVDCLIKKGKLYRDGKDQHGKVRFRVV